jgi:methylase of polypeptide subunit release factors
MLKKIMVKTLYKLYAKLILRVRASTFIFKLLFSYQPPTSKYDNYWDWTTLIIKKHLPQYISKGMNILDMGTGPYAVLAYFIENKFPGCRIAAADYCLELIVYAKQSNPKTSISFLDSDLFESINGLYDLIIFNAPYISAEKGKSLGITESQLAEKRWQGGDTGAETIERFLLSSPEHLSKQGVILLGVNHFYLDAALLKQVIGKCGYKIISQDKNKFTQSGLFALRRKQQ